MATCSYYILSVLVIPALPSLVILIPAFAVAALGVLVATRSRTA